MQIIPELPARSHFQIDAVDSTSNVQVQIADWIAGALARYYENKTNGKDFYILLQRNIRKEAELFSDYWTNKWG